MTNEEFAIILKHINLMIDQSLNGNADDIVEVLDQIQNSIKFYLHIMEEE